MINSVYWYSFLIAYCVGVFYPLSTNGSICNIVQKCLSLSVETGHHLKRTGLHFVFQDLDFWPAMRSDTPLLLSTVQNYSAAG